MPHPAPELSGSRLALVVATATYHDAGLNSLRAPAQDAADMAEVLADPEIGGFEVTQVLDRPEPEIRRTIARFLHDRALDDLVVIYLSCHGVLDDRNRLYFATTDTEKSQLAATAVESGWLLDRLEECRARRQVLILDCCFSGAFDGKSGESEVDLRRRLMGSGRGRAVLTASRASEYSYEGTPLGDAVDRSLFTAGLVEGLRTGQADHDKDGYITVDDAYTYAANHVHARGGAQSPQHWLYGGEGAIFLAQNPLGPALTPAPLPEDLASALDNRYPSVRLAAVAELGKWLTSSDPAQTLAAEETLHRVAYRDTAAAVVATARDLLRAASVWVPPATDRRRRLAIPYYRLRTITATHWTVNGGINDLDFSPDAKLLASASDDGTVRLWDPATGRQIGEPLKGHHRGAGAVAFSPDGRLLASGGGDGTVRLWDPPTGARVGSPLSGHTDGVAAVAFSPDGRLLASAGGDETVRLWDPVARERAADPLTSPGERVWSVAFSPDGRHLAAAGGATVRLWDLAASPPTSDALTGHDRGMKAVAFSPDGRLLASAGDDRSIRLWDPATSNQTARLTGHFGWVRAIAFSPDGQLLASVSRDKTVRLWNPRTGRRTGHPLTGHAESLWTAAFSPDGRMLATSGRERTIQLWGPEP